ncbi:hypothetical protein O6H91_05G077700 [Diphasiastrum complanatum]|uniref:Uncharacterized protein n=1 Tax=Diphasiastrum complanatum TaxID=34168 RepID=A0ACC2DPT6_DIPCM|nr:hypothetical protein O6H91_05G077700 [Diphasiastrum complanatum]
MSTVSALGNRTLEQLKVPELKEELRKRGILPKGLKKELVERLEQALREEAQVGNFSVQYVPEDFSENAANVSETQEDVFHASKPQEDAPDVSKTQKDAPHASEPQEDASQFLADEVKLESPLAENLTKAEEMKTSHPVPMEGESVKAICLAEERKTADETSLLVTTGFQSHPQLSACQVSVNLHQMGNSIEKLGQDVKVDQTGLDLMQIQGCNELMEVQSVSPLEDAGEEGSSLLPSSMHPESKQIAEPSQLIADDTPVVVKASIEMSSDHGKMDLSSAGTNVSRISEPLVLDSELLAETFEERLVKPFESVETVESLIPEEITMEDKSVETLISEQTFMEDKTVNEKSLVISESNIAKLDTLTEAVPGVLESASGEAFGGGIRTQKDEITFAREDRFVEPRKHFEEKVRSREGLDIRMKDNEIKRSDREAPRDKRELLRSRLSQEGIAKVKEEVEKARPKDRGRGESGFRRTESRVKRDSVEEKVELQTVKEELGGKGYLRQGDDQLKVRDIKPMDVDSDVSTGLKRRESDEDSRQVEPLKRQRRWNSGNTLKTDSDVKPLSKSMMTEREKDIIPYVKPLTGNDSSLPASMLSPASSRGSKPTSKGLVPGGPDQQFGSRHASYASKTDDASNGESLQKRIVPAPTRSATTSLRIDRFLRPFTLNAVKELLAQTGTYQEFWMDHIKSHCYVTYSTVEEAIATRNALYNLQWPSAGGKMLVAEFVDPDEVKDKCKSAVDKPNATAVTTPCAAASLNDQISPSSAGRLPTFGLPPPPPPQREKATSPPKKEQEPAIPTLDDLFKKTRAKPHIYYLPLTEEQVTTKLARSKASISKLTTRL